MGAVQRRAEVLMAQTSKRILLSHKMVQSHWVPQSGQAVPLHELFRVPGVSTLLL